MQVSVSVSVSGLHGLGLGLDGSVSVSVSVSVSDLPVSVLVSVSDYPVSTTTLTCSTRKNWQCLTFKCTSPLMYSAFAIELSDLSKPFKFARLKGFERLENCPTKGTYMYERFWKVKQLSEQTYHSPIFLPFKSFQRVLKGVVVQ